MGLTILTRLCFLTDVQLCALIRLSYKYLKIKNKKNNNNNNNKTKQNKTKLLPRLTILLAWLVMIHFN